MATSRSPSRVLGSSYNSTPLSSPPRTQYTFSTQRAEFTKPVPAALLPVYPTFAQDSDSDDEASVVNMLTQPMTTPEGQKSGRSAVEGKCYQDVDTMATVGQSALVRGFAEKSGISPTSNLTNLPMNTADLDRSPGEIDDLKAQPEIYSNSVMARLASLLGLQKRRERRLAQTSNIVASATGAPLPALSPVQDAKYSPFLSPLQSDSLRPGFILSTNSSLNAEDLCNTNMPAVIEDERSCDLAESEQLKLPLKQRRQGHGSSATYPPPVLPNLFLRHRRSRSLDIDRTPTTRSLPSDQASLITFAQEVLPPDSRSRSVHDQTRCEQSTSMDDSVWISSSPSSVPPNCVLVQVWAVGLDESDKQLGRIIDEAHKFKRSQEAFDQEGKKCKEIREEGPVTIFNGSKLLGWSFDFGAKKRERKPTLGSLTIGKRMVREVSLPTASQSLEAGDIPGQSFVGRVLGVGSVVEKSFAGRDDWVVGLVDIKKCGPLAKFIVIDWRQVHRVPAPYEPCPLDHANSTSSTLVPESPPGKPTEDVVCDRDTDGKCPLPHFTPSTFEELALLPLCGIPAYRAVKTCIDAFPVGHGNFNGASECPHPNHNQRRALVLRGHEGIGAMAVQMLVRQGWRVSVHVPFSRVPWNATQAEADRFMVSVEERLKMWGADEVVYDDGIGYVNWDEEMDDRKAAVVRVIETLRADGDVFDAVLDLVGGKEIREASERLLRLNGYPAGHGVGQFTTLHGDAVGDPISTLAEKFHSNLSNFTLHDSQTRVDEHIEGLRDNQSGEMGRRVNHTVMEGVFESELEEVCETLGTVVRLTLEDGIRPHVEQAGGEIFGGRRVVPLEKVSDVVRDGDLLSDGTVVVVRVVA